jgi:uncharacterized protein YjbI with pentapeptide repeats
MSEGSISLDDSNLDGVSKVHNDFSGVVFSDVDFSGVSSKVHDRECEID